MGNLIIIIGITYFSKYTKYSHHYYENTEIMRDGNSNKSDKVNQLGFAQIIPIQTYSKPGKTLELYKEYLEASDPSLSNKQYHLSESKQLSDNEEILRFLKNECVEVNIQANHILLKLDICYDKQYVWWKNRGIIEDINGQEGYSILKFIEEFYPEKGRTITTKFKNPNSPSREIKYLSADEYFQLFKDDNESVKYGEKIQPGQIQNCILDNSKNHIIVAAPRMGKTSNTIKVLQQNKKKFIFLVPLRALARQIIEDGQYESPLELCMGKVKQKQLEKIVSQNDYIVATYNKFSQIHGEIKHKANEYILVIDEIHKLVSDSDYREKELRFIANNMRDYQKVIGLTGTPDLCFSKAYLASNNFILKRFESDYDGIKIDNYHLSYCSSEINDKTQFETFKLLVINNSKHYLNNSRSQKPIVVFINNKEFIEDFIKDLEIEFNLTSDEKGDIARLTRDYNDSEDFEKLLEDQTIDVNKKFIFATSAISTGVNIRNDKLDYVYIYNERNLIEVIQFINRFRNGVKNIYDFISVKDGDISFLNLEKETSARINYLNEISVSFNQLVLSGNFPADKLFPVNPSKPNNKKENILSNNYIYKNGNLSMVDNLKIRWDLLKDSYEIISIKHELRIRYLKLYDRNNRVNIRLLELLGENIDKSTKDQKQKIKRQLIKKFKEKLESRTEELITSYYQKLGKKPTQRNIREFVMTDRIKIPNLYLRFFSEDKCKAHIAYFISAINAGFTKENALKIVFHKDAIKLSYAVDYLGCMQLLKKPKHIRTKYENSIQSKLEAVEIIREHLVTSSNNINFSELKQKLKSLRKQNSISEYFSKDSYSKLKYIYDIRKHAKKYVLKEVKPLKLADIFRNAGILLSKKEETSLKSYILH